MRIKGQESLRLLEQLSPLFRRKSRGPGRSARVRWRSQLSKRWARFEALTCVSDDLKWRLRPLFRRATHRLIFDARPSAQHGGLFLFLQSLLALVLISGLAPVAIWAQRRSGQSHHHVLLEVTGFFISYIGVVGGVVFGPKLFPSLTLVTLFTSVAFLALPTQHYFIIRPLMVGALFFGLYVSLIYGLLLPSAIADQRGTHRNADALIIDALVDLLYLVDANQVLWAEKPFRMLLAQKLDFLAALFSRRYAASWKVNNANIQMQIHTQAESIASSVRDLQIWLFIPKEDTRLRFTEKLTEYLHLCSYNNWDSLPRTTSMPVVHWQHKVRRFAIGVIGAAVPALLLVFVQKVSGSQIPDPARTYLYGGAILWATLSVLAALDPQYNSKLEAMKGLLPFIGGERKKD